MTTRTLHIGINQYGHGSDLAGCVNDANDFAAAFAGRGAITSVITDRDATGDRLRQSIRILVGNLTRGDLAVITYSGHGTQVPDLNGDESDHRDEAWCPVDLWDNGVITDDELRELLDRRPFGARLVVVSDSCNSGTVTRFASPLGARHRARYLPPAAFLDPTVADRLARTPTRRTTGTSALLLSGCADTEYSYDATFGDRPNGAFTYVALRALTAVTAGGKTATFRRWHQTIREALPSQDYPQTPQLLGTSSQKNWTLG